MSSTESATPGAHSAIVRLGLRYGMTLFIASEVMFFVGFFWAYFNFLMFPETQGNGHDGVAAVGRPHIRSVPPAVPEHDDPAAVRHAPSPGRTTALLEGNRKGLLQGLALTDPAGPELHHVSRRSNIPHAPFKFTGGGVYPSVFFLATGFHGFHVIVGTCFLIVCWFRARDGHSRRSGISASRRRPGTGISSTWCGCSFSSASTGMEPADRARVV